MLRRIIPTVLMAIVATWGLGNATIVAAQAKPTAGDAQVQNCYAVGSHFVNRYWQNSVGWGCATTPEYTYGNGRYQKFTHGEMDWSPSQGAEMVVSGMTRMDGYGNVFIDFQFGSSLHWNYDSWLVRAYHDGVALPQVECFAGSNGPLGYCSRTDGLEHIGPVSPGNWWIVIEGCDVSWTGSHTCDQGWTIPVDVRV
jgi:hypothetical protein